MAAPQAKFFVFGCLVLFGLIFFWTMMGDSSVEVEDLSPVPPAIKVDDIRSRAANMHLLREKYEDPNNYKLLEDVEQRCSALTQNEQLKDLDCTSVWLSKLRNAEITDAEKWWGFRDTHNGAITLRLGDMRAMFKPCSSKSEDTSKEVIASYLDQLLQWGQTAPVMTRRIPISLLEQFVDPGNELDMEAFTTTRDTCAKGDYFEGPMIGWWDSLIPIRTMKKKDLEVPQLLKLRPELGRNKLTTQMQSKYHAFYFMINILRHGKDEFITRNGDLVSLDLDRSRFQSTKPITSTAVNYTWCFTCYMDKWVYDSFQAVGPKQPESLRLGYLMREVLLHEDIFEDIWKSSLGASLDKRVAMLLSCINDCIQKYGAENVLLDEPYDSMTGKEKVEWFVKHSEYKNMNGKRGPSNLEFLEDL